MFIMRAMINAVFFDLDETLVDAEQAHAKATIQAFAYFGYDYLDIRKKSPDHISRGMRVKDNLKARRDGAGISEVEIPIEKLIEVREKFFLELVKKEAFLLKGAQEILRLMKDKNIQVAIVSSGTKDYLSLILDIFRFKNLIDFVVSGDDVQEGKPNPECYLKAYEVARLLIPTLETKECLVFEDTKAGITAGKKAGMRVVFIPTPGSVMPTTFFPDYQINSLLEFDKSILAE
jgi:HAD superfamily hydrolase (TIGR01509 family)